MRQFQVPQFITVEDKVIGPFTIRQFLYIGGGGLLIVAFYRLFESYIFFPVAIFIGALSAALAFLKINQQSFPTVLKNAVSYALRPRLYTWRKEALRPKRGHPQKQETVVAAIPKLWESKLSDLAWSLDIKEKTRT